MGGDSRSEGQGFESRDRILDGHFFTKICNACLKRPKINEKEAGVGPFKKKDISIILYLIKYSPRVFPYGC